MSDPLDHVCPICEGEGEQGYHCFCNGVGVITEQQAKRFADEGLPAVRLPAPPKRMSKPCVDCAFRRGSQEREDGSLDAIKAHGKTFYCHQGMHLARGRYVPRQEDSQGQPVGHPVCAGWARFQRRKKAVAA